MFSGIEIRSKWSKSGEEAIEENGEICAAYQIIGISTQNNLVEIESALYLDDQVLSRDLYTDLVSRKENLSKFSVNILFYSAAESFIKKYAEDGKRFRDIARSDASKHYVSPIQSLRSFEIPMYSLGSEESVGQEISSFNHTFSR